jgi:hemoglobin-like flavoprotein
VGKKHVAMGVPIDTFPIFGEALMYALQTKLGKGWSKDIENAWLEVYEVLSGEMISVMNKNSK